MEFVLVVPRREVFRECYPQGLTLFGEGLAREAFDAAVDASAFFVEREHAEHAPDLKQLIPYSLLMREGDGGPEVMLLRRLPRGGEKRLHGKLSIGVGGHVEPADLPHAGTRRAAIDAGARRELEEELVIEGTLHVRQVGLVNDDSNPVGAVHLGLVQVVLLEGDAHVRETDLLEGRFVPPAELARLRASGAPFESWSALLVDRLELFLSRTPGARGALVS